MNSQKHEFFSLVRVPSERKKIFSQLVESRSEILVKGSSGNLYHLSPLKISENDWLLCQYENGSMAIDPSSTFEEMHSANFAIGVERYFFQSNVQVSPNSVILETKVELYHLQRRKSLRVQLPAQLGASCNIINHNDVCGLYACEILDFSVGGLRILFHGDNPHFKFHDRLVLMLRLGHNRKPFEVQAQVRHVMEESKPGHQIFGLQFMNKDKLLENKLLVLQLDLQTEIFRKWRLHQG